MPFDLVIRGGTVVTAEKKLRADIGVQGEKIAALGDSLSGKTIIDARGKLVLPGGVDSHCHVEQLSSTGKMCADDFYSATVAAAFGGTTTIIPFAAQHRGNSIIEVVDDYARRAAEKAVIDYGFHLIIADPTPKALDEELPLMVKRGISSFKVYMTYELLRLSDGQMLDVLAAAEREKALVMVHAENHEMIQWLTRRLLERGHGAPKFHMSAHHPLAEAEATHLVLERAPRGQQQDMRLEAVLAPPVEHGQPVFLGQHQVEDDGIVVGAAGLEVAFLAVVGHVDGKALLLECLPQGPHEGFVILDQ